MTHYRSLSHTKWTCQYHVVFLPKYRKKVIYGGVAPGPRGGVANFVSTVGRDEQAIRTHIREQEQEERRQAQLRLDPSSHL